MGLSILNNSNLKIVHKEPKYSIPWFCFIGDENRSNLTSRVTREILKLLGIYVRSLIEINYLRP